MKKTMKFSKGWLFDLREHDGKRKRIENVYFSAGNKTLNVWQSGEKLKALVTIFSSMKREELIRLRDELHGLSV